MKEADLHRQVCDYLDLCLPTPDAWYTTFPADGGSLRGRIGLKRGVPDILIIYRGSAFWIELKTARGRISDHQVLTAHKLGEAGYGPALARSLDDVVEAIGRWGIPVRGKLS